MSATSASLREQLPVNNLPLNRAAKKWLREAKAPIDGRKSYLLGLLWWGLEQGVPLPGQGARWKDDLALAAGNLMSERHDPAPSYRWIISNPNGPAREEQAQTLLPLLLQAKTWQEAAQEAMQVFYDRAAATNPHFQPAASSRD